MKEEYTYETYPSIGKKYNGEKAIISLTSWKARINTVSKTLFSLLVQCPGFHIVLVLSEEEFPNKEADLPDELMLFINTSLIEILWVNRNYKSFKKIVFTMNKYRTVPIISADDDCIYKCNYAESLYTTWQRHQSCCISYWVEDIMIDGRRFTHTGGQGTLFPPYCFSELGINRLNINRCKASAWQDDCYYAYLRHIKKINCIRMRKENSFAPICYQNNDKYALRHLYRKIGTAAGIKAFLKKI